MFEVVVRVTVEVTEPLELAVATATLGTVNGDPGIVSGDVRSNASTAILDALTPLYSDPKNGLKIHGLVSHTEDYVPVPGA
jgi:hypothetical protein